MARRTKGKLDAGLLLLLTPVLWGATFPGTKIALRRLPVVPFMAWSRILGLAAILVLLPLLRRATPEPRRRVPEVLVPGAILGALMFVGYFLQTEGLARTTATNAGFITGLYVVFTPILGLLAFAHRPPRSAWAAVLISFCGLTLLSVRDLGSIRFHAGDLFVAGGAVAWAGHITAVGYYSRRFPPWMLSLAQMAVSSLFHLIAAAPGGLRLGAAISFDVWPLLILTGVLGSGVAFTIQILAQRTLTPVRAVILLAGESLFSAAFAAVWIDERLAIHQWGGALLVLVAMAFSELSARRPAEELIEPAAVP